MLRLALLLLLTMWDDDDDETAGLWGEEDRDSPPIQFVRADAIRPVHSTLLSLPNHTTRRCLFAAADVTIYGSVISHKVVLSGMQVAFAKTLDANTFVVPLAFFETDSMPSDNPPTNKGVKVHTGIMCIDMTIAPRHGQRRDAGGTLAGDDDDAEKPTRKAAGKNKAAPPPPSITFDNANACRN